MTFSSHTLLFEPHSHRFFGKRFWRLLPMDGVRSRIVLPNLSGGHAGKSASRSIRNGNVTTDNVSVIVHNAHPLHFHFSRSHLRESFFACSIRFCRAPNRQKVIRHGANFRVGEAEGEERQGFVYRVAGPGIDYIRRANCSKPIIMVNPRTGAEYPAECATFSSTR